MVGSHLDNRHLVFRFQLKQRERYPDMIVEVTLRKERIVFLRKHRSDQLFGSGLSVGACNAYDRRFQSAPVYLCQLLKRVQTAID